MKEPQTLQNKETTVQNYRKMSNQNIALFNCTGEMGMNNFGYLNSSFYFISNF